MSLPPPACEIGTPAPDFALKTPDGETHSRDSLMGASGLVVIFMCNHCPYVKGVIDRLVADIKQLQDAGFGVACIMSNDYIAYPADAPAEMARFSEQHGLTAPYLIDEDQSVARAYGAVCTPDLFGYDAKGRLQYRGRLDSAGIQGDPATRTPELLEAMLLVKRTGKGPEEQTPSMGCSIKWR